MMVCASNATERGRTIGWRDEDIATALDLDTEQVAAIREAMQGRVLDGDILSGWDRRQSIREDETAAARAKAFREREKEKKLAEEAAAKALANAKQTQPNATERNQTTEVEVEVEVEIEVDKKKNKVKSNAPPSGEAAEVFGYWQRAMNHPQARLDAKRERAIKARLKDGYTVAQLCKAVDGCKLSPHHMGQNETRTVYDDIELICRDGPRVDKFIGWVERGGGSGMSPKLAQQVDILQTWLKKQED
jgi:hypothetical protein